MKMAQFDPIARAIDWVDACKSNDWRSVGALYAEDAASSIAALLHPGSAIVLTGIDEIQNYWMEAFQTGTARVFELVEIYPGCSSVVLIYYDQHCHRICEFLQFNEAGLISNAARHVIPQRRQVAPMPIDSASGEDFTMSGRNRALHCEARQNFGEARQLPVGPARNGLRQRAIVLNSLSKNATYCA
jgi:hypothetical protein